MTGSRIALLTGPVGVGKTTVAGRVLSLARQQGLSCRGLLAPAILDDCGHKAGIWGLDVASGERRILARTDRDLAGPRLGPYSFDAAALDWALSLLRAALDQGPPPASPSCDLLLVDEIGKLELWQGIGLAPILPRLAAGQARRALVVVREALLGELQGRLGGIEQRIFAIGPANRDALASRILAELMAGCAA